MSNVTFSGINQGYDCGTKGFEFYHLLQEKRFVGITHFSGMKLELGTKREDVIHLSCRYTEDPFDIKTFLVEDIDGAIGLTGLPGFYVSNNPVAQAFIPDANCLVHTRGCGMYCDDVCLRNVEIKVDPILSCGDPCFGQRMRISNGLITFDYMVSLLCSLSCFS